MADYDRDKVDEVTLALLYLNSFDDEFVVRAWKGFDWHACMKKGLLATPKAKPGLLS